MADSRQQSIIAAIVTRMQTLLVGSGGYTTSLATDANSVRCCRDSETHWDQTSELPAISVFEMPAEVNEHPRMRRNVIHTMPVQIKIFLVRGTTAGTARTAIQDVLKAIQSTGSDTNDWIYERFPETIGNKQIGLAMEVNPKRHGIDYEPDTNEIVAAIVEIEVRFITPKWEL
jgi:hypothetical protein